MRRFVTTICLAVAIGTTGSSVIHANADPPFGALASSSYYGAFGLDEANDLVVDADGFIYLAGWSESETDLDGFVVKLTPDGSQVVYATRIGGSGFDVAVGLAVDPAGGVVVVGQTESADFPLVNALQADLRGGFDSWVARLNDAGAIVYATYYGGSSFENASAIAVGPSGAVYVTGSTGSLDLPGAAGAQPSYGGGTGDGFVVKIRPDGSALMYATYLGGTGDEFASDIAVDATDHAYVVGGTGSRNLPLASPLQPTYGGGFKDGFVTSISPDGAQFAFSTYLGGSDWDQILGVDVDASGRVYLAGMTWSTGFPTQTAYQPVHAGGFSDAFVARLGPGGLGIDYATLLGGSGYDVGVRIVADADGHAHVAGETDSPTFPLVGQVQDQVNGTDAFYARLSPDGASLLRSTPLGGSGADVARGLALAAGGDVWIGGSTDSQDFPVVTAFQPDPGGSIDALRLETHVDRVVESAASRRPRRRPGRIHGRMRRLRHARRIALERSRWRLAAVRVVGADRHDGGSARGGESGAWPPYVHAHGG